MWRRVWNRELELCEGRFLRSKMTAENAGPFETKFTCFAALLNRVSWRERGLCFPSLVCNELWPVLCLAFHTILRAATPSIVWKKAARNEEKKPFGNDCGYVSYASVLLDLPSPISTFGSLLGCENSRGLASANKTRRTATAVLGTIVNYSWNFCELFLLLRLASKRGPRLP